MDYSPLSNEMESILSLCEDIDEKDISYSYKELISSVKTFLKELETDTEENKKKIHLINCMLKTIIILVTPEKLNNIFLFRDRHITGAFEVIAGEYVSEKYSYKNNCKYTANYCPPCWQVKDIIVGNENKCSKKTEIHLINVQAKTSSDFGIQKMKEYGKRLKEQGVHNLLFVSLNKFALPYEKSRELYIKYRVSCIFFEDLLKDVWNSYMESNGKKYSSTMHAFEYFTNQVGLI